MPKIFFDFLPLAIVALIVLRRSGRSRSVRTQRMWVTPILSTVAVGMTLAQEPVPGLAAMAVLSAGALAGLGAGYLRALHIELTIDKEGAVLSRATPVGTLLIAGFLLVRFGLDYAINGGWWPGPPRFVNPPAHGVDLLRLADAALIFTTAMMVSQRAEIWRRAQTLLKVHRERAQTALSPN
jgi:hypothetical protein